jgi:hypothetical protein
MGRSSVSWFRASNCFVQTGRNADSAQLAARHRALKNGSWACLPPNAICARPALTTVPAGHFLAQGRSPSSFSHDRRSNSRLGGSETSVARAGKPIRWCCRVWRCRSRDGSVGSPDAMARRREVGPPSPSRCAVMVTPIVPARVGGVPEQAAPGDEVIAVGRSTLPMALCRGLRGCQFVDAHRVLRASGGG